MNAVGMIVEYNPFHNGHLWHLKEARRLTGADCAIAVMSGNFMQRGEPAMADKWSRAAMAVACGVDLVIELPVVFAVRSAQYFATGAISLLGRLGVVNHVCFGAETADLAMLTAAARALSEDSIIGALRQKMKTGMTYAASLASTLAEHCAINATMLQSPNNILAIEYLRAIETYAPQLTPLPIQRLAANYHDQLITSKIASATAIRTAMLANSDLPPGSTAWQAVPPACAEQINHLITAGRAPVMLQCFSNIILAKLRTMPLEELANLPDVAEGLHYKINAAAQKSSTVQELLSHIKSKRYPFTRLQRIIVHALLNTTKNEVAGFDQSGPLYARILAFNDNGRKLIRELGKQSLVPAITKISQYLTSKQQHQDKISPLQTMLAYDLAATDIYVLGYPNYRWRAGCQDYLISPRYIAEPTIF